MDDCYLSIVIPAYNEEKRILPTIKRVCDYLAAQNYSYEIIVVDDGSSDNTAQLIKDFIKPENNVSIIANGANRGKGFTVRNGVLSANGKYIFFTDADLSTPIEELEKCLPFLQNGYEVVIGSRSLPDSDIIVHQPWYREMMGKIFNFIVTVILLEGIVDTQCGFKGFTKEAAKTVFNKCGINGFSFDVEALYLSRKQKYNIKEVPISWKDATLSKVNPIKHSLQMFLDLLVIKMRGFRQ